MNDGGVLVKREGDILVEERLRREPGHAHEVVVLVLVFQIERLRRAAVAGGEHVVHVGEGLAADAVQRLGGSAAPVFAAENRGGAAQLDVDGRVQRAGVFALEGFRHRRLGHETVFLHQIRHHVPLAAVLNAGGHDVGHHAVVLGQVERLHDGIEEVVGLFQLIVIGDEVLGKLEEFHVHLLRRDFAEQVQRGEQPAAAAGFLVGYLHGFHFVIEQEAPLRGVFAVENHFVQRLMTHGQRRRLHDGVRAIGVVHRGEHVACNLHGKPSFARRRSSDATMILR